MLTLRLAERSEHDLSRKYRANFCTIFVERVIQIKREMDATS